MCSMLDFTMCVQTGPPDNVSNITIKPDQTEACTFIVRWNGVSNDSECGSVSYTVTVFTFENRQVFAHITSYTYCMVPGLNSINTYTIHVTASNNAGNSSEVTHMMTSNGKFASCTYVALTI